MRVVVLARVSTDEETQDPRSQLAALRRVAGRKGWDIAREVVLELSAWDPEEAAEVFDEALSAVQEEGADVLAVWKLDRFARGGIQDVLSKLRRLEHLGVSLFSVQEPFLSTTDPATRELLVSLIGWMDERESARISDRVRAKYEAKAERAAERGESVRWGREREEVPVEVLARIREGLVSQSAAARELGVSQPTVSRRYREWLEEVE